MRYWGFYVKQHSWVNFNVLGSASWVLSYSKKAIAVHSLSFNLVIHFSTHLMSDKQEVLLFWLLSLHHGFSCFLWEVGPLSEEAFTWGKQWASYWHSFHLSRLPKHHVKGSPTLLAPFFISSQIVWWWYIPKKESRECGGGEGKVPVLTATLMASIWGFWWKAPLDPSTQTTVNSPLLPWHNHSSVLPFLTISFSPWGYNWWPADTAEASRLVTLDWPASK